MVLSPSGATIVTLEPERRDAEHRTGRSAASRTGESVSLRPSRRVSAACLLIAAASFVVAWVLTFAVARDLVVFFYQPRILAVVHTLTLGWISLSMIGVLYQFVPALTKHPVAWPRAAGWQVALYALGTAGMIACFWIGNLRGTAWSAGVVMLAVVLFAAQILPPLLRAPRRDATVVGVAAAAVYFVAVALLGFLYALDKVHSFLAGSVLSNIAGHAHLGLVGWITLTICAISYRMVTAFLLPAIPLPRAARRQVVLLIVTVPLLVGALLLQSRTAPLFGLFVGAAMLWYAVILARLAAVRRMPIDWSLRHVGAALVHLFVAILSGLALFVIEPGAEAGSRLVAVYGLFLLVGWVSNYVVGMANRMAPGIMGLGGALLGEREAATVFWLLNGGVVAAAASLLGGSVLGLCASALLLLGAALLFAAGFARRLRD